MKNKISSGFICAKCKGNLLRQEQKFQCSNCMSEFIIDNGIIDFRGKRQDYYFNPVSSTDMDTLIDQMKVDNWSETVRSFIKYVGPKSPDSWIDNLVVDGRYAWKIFLDLNEGKNLLDIGCGLGNLVSNLAPHVGKVYAMDLTYKRLQFTQKRSSIFNASTNFSFIAGGDQRYLPFPDHSVDCVTLSGVLEWVGEGASDPHNSGSKLRKLWNMLALHFGATNPRNIQIAFLKEIKRVLKEDGQLFVGIENRLNYEYFISRPDHHSNLKYGSLMPRFIANVYSILVKHRPYRTFTYSIPGYRKLFADAGFDSLEFVGLFNGYSFLRQMLPFSKSGKVWEQGKVKSLKKKISANKYFVPAYGIIASSSERKSTSLHDKIFSAISQKMDGNIPSNFTVKDYIVTDKEKLVMRCNVVTKDVVVKIPLNGASLLAQERNKDLLTKVSGLSISPNFICQVEVNGLQGFVEEEVKGSAISTLIPSRMPLKDLYQSVGKLLNKLNPMSTIFEGRIEFLGEVYERVVEYPLEALFEELKDRKLDNYLRNYFSENLRGKYISSGIYHGDVSISNIIATSDNSYQLIDWEGGMENGIPILDSINFAGSCYRYLNTQATMSDTIDILIGDSFKDTEERRFLAKQYDYWGIDPCLHKGLVYLNWLSNISHLLSFSLRFNEKNINELIYDVVAEMKGGCKYLSQ
ncbi:class I SAM-dependent methyltransferase [Nitrosomonas sp. H1_AOB3]|uniref:class I SAM-dependent methyltransferase n=1 Tax=Nitrosomonas sp. H1_AOB3 TaxID=2741553 RepID=UPI0019367C51|nr:class I SAM-dependent methyltransferase [Nitrosomonas sp. H1_AOB3]QOJ08257.1 MAG: class I SAM-dependent methyltransferase [Nitrosomonas sp. H1_AOB3]